MRKFQKLFVVVSVIVLSMAFSTMAFAAQDVNIKLNLNGKAITFKEDNKPIIIDGSTMFQVRAMFDLLNEDGSYTLDWNDADKMAVFANETTTVKIWVGNSDADVNGKKVKIAGAVPTIINDRLYVPFRFIADSFGMTVSWNPKNSTIGAMDEATLDKISGLMNGYNEQYDKDAKVYMEFKADMNMNMEYDSESQNITMVMGGTIEQDLANKYQHMKMNIDMDMGASLGKVSQNVEMYDDGVNSYTSDGDKFVKGDSSLAIMDVDYIEQIKNSFDFNTMAELEKNSYASVLLKTNAAGNYMLEGSILVPDDMLQTMLGTMSESMGVGGIMGDLTMNMPDPVNFVYVINKDTGELMSMKMDFNANMTMGISGEEVKVVYKFKIDVPKIETNAKFTSVVPALVKLSK